MFKWMCLPTDPDASTCLSVKNVFTALEKINDWYTFGILADVPPHVLNSFTNGQVRSKQETINYWLHNDPDASWEKLANILEKMSFRCIAQEIRKQHVQHAIRVKGNTVPSKSPFH